ncbi:polyprenyl synthetase family protein [Dactylosporangium sp. NBC_01737]|uniref:polyprenyl synthetase family protein n=1 Tax=Dactylosporangium sp. NBC_01737 TaxID=2975959 RepID=UPI002E0FFCDA|nr:polyprenyl synthetase family protein [Dactylosporangium sp. NBC_01737]
MGVGHTLADFRRWSAHHPALIDQYTDRCTEQLLAARRFTVRRRAAEHVRQAREVAHFSVFNLAEVPSPEQVEAAVSGSGGRPPTVREVLAGIDDRDGVAGVVAALERHLPPLRGAAELQWLTERLKHLHRILPEAVVQAGGMGKVLRAMTGVLLIAAQGGDRAGPHTARARLAGVVRGAYGFGAAYAIVDDTLHDLPADHFSVEHRERLHELAVKGLATGQPADAGDVPSHPLAEELHTVHLGLLDDYAFDEHRHLYHAAESMYLAQHRDAQRATDPPAARQPDDLYPDMFVKAGMSRVIANLLARRELDDGFYRRCINMIFISQLRDDLIDAADDQRDGRRTPFTTPPGPDRPDGPNPLHDLFAYQSYVAAEVFGGDPVAADALAYYTSTRLGRHLAADPGRADVLRRRFAPTGTVERFLAAATGRSGRVDRRRDVAEQRLRERAGQLLRHRSATTVDCRTFIADRLPYLNGLLDRHRPAQGSSDLDAVVAYALAGSGKRLRPALGLMLAEGLGIQPAAIEPVLVAGELFHTASLIFDDLPAQDGATVRRGRPAAHLVYGEASAQLAALSMISSGFGLVARLDRRFPAQRVTAVIEYVGSVLGPQGLCRGQHLDLRLGQDGTPATAAEIIEMYSLKTSTAIEAALVPLLMLLDRPPEQISLLKRYAHHAGVVFQLHDDVLDATSSTRQLGKDAGLDARKANIVRTCGLAEARRLTAVHLDAAVSCCERLPFDTDLLACAVRHFATRQR